MKEKYIKPLLSIEMFSMTQSIARDCGDHIPFGSVTLNDIPQCSLHLGGEEFLFVLGTNCTMEGENSGYVCYNNPSAEILIFRS